MRPATLLALIITLGVFIAACDSNPSEPEIVYVDRVVEVPVETIVEKVVYRDRPVEVVREIPVEVVVEKVVYRDAPGVQESPATARTSRGLDHATLVPESSHTPPLSDSASLTGVWIASNDSLYVMRDPERPDTLEFAGAFEGGFLPTVLEVVGMDFDSEGRLWIASRDMGGGYKYEGLDLDDGHAIFRLDDLGRPNTLEKTGVHRATGDTFMSVEKFAGIVVDGEDTVWGVDKCGRMLKLVEHGMFSRESGDKLLTPADDEASEYCQVPYKVDIHDGTAYTTALGTVYSIPDFGYSGAGVELGSLPLASDVPLGFKPESIHLSGITIDSEGVAWGWRNGTAKTPREWWKIEDIHNPEETAYKVADLPEGFPVIRGMAAYEGAPALVVN